MKKYLIILPIFAVLLSGCGDNGSVQVLDTMEKMNANMKSLDNKLVLMQQEIDSQKKTILDLKTTQESMKTQTVINDSSVKSYTELPKEKQSKYIEIAKALQLKLVNAKSEKTKEDYKKIIDAIIVDPDNYMKQYGNIDLGVYGKFTGTYTNEKIGMTQSGTYLYEADVTGTSLNNKTNKTEKGTYHVTLEFVFSKSDVYKIVSSNMALTGE